MKTLRNRVLCPECGAVRIRNRRSPHAVCPNGHGKLVPRFSRHELREVLSATIPRARRIRRNTFVVDGYQGLFCYRGGKGRKRATPGMAIEPGEVIARHVTGRRQLIRVFSRKPTTAARKKRPHVES